MTEVKGDAHLEQSYKDNLKYYKNDLTLKTSAVKKQKKKPVKKSGPSNKKGDGVEQNCVTERNQTSIPVVQESESMNVEQVASNDVDDNQQDSDVSSIATVAESANKKRKRVVIKLRPKKKGKKTRMNNYEIVPDLTNENNANEEAQRNLPQQSERESGLERHNESGTSEAVNKQTSKQQNNGNKSRRRKKRPTKFNGLVYVALYFKASVFC